MLSDPLLKPELQVHFVKSPPTSNLRGADTVVLLCFSPHVAAVQERTPGTQVLEADRLGSVLAVPLSNYVTLGRLFNLVCKPLVYGTLL